jgi:hypothetical protein
MRGLDGSEKGASVDYEEEFAVLSEHLQLSDVIHISLMSSYYERPRPSFRPVQLNTVPL